MKQEDIDFLEHFGVKGMKWGVRRSPEQLSRARGDSPDAAANRKLKKKRANQLSTSELRSSIDRMNLERQYRKMNPKGVAKGAAFVTAGLAVGVTLNRAIEFNRSPAGQAIRSSVNKAIKKGS